MAGDGIAGIDAAQPERFQVPHERATCFRRYVTAAVRKPALVGYHWFEHADQPAEGRFDGENSNFGTVTIGDDVYEELTQTMSAINAEAEDHHAAAGRAAA